MIGGPTAAERNPLFNDELYAARLEANLASVAIDRLPSEVQAARIAAMIEGAAINRVPSEADAKLTAARLEQQRWNDARFEAWRAREQEAQRRFETLSPEPRVSPWERNMPVFPIQRNVPPSYTLNINIHLED